jgi:hypothetical protein
MDLLLYLKIIGGAAVVSLALAVMAAFSPNRRRVWVSEAALARRRTLPYILVSWGIGWVVLSAGGIYLMHYIASFGS